MAEETLFLQGLRLFNQGHYFECHEVIEKLWLKTPDGHRDRNLYKGIIQAAAAIYQWDRGILSGALGLSRSAVSYLEDYLPRARGLNTQKLVEELKACFNALETWDGKNQVERDKRRAPVLEYCEKDVETE